MNLPRLTYAEIVQRPGQRSSRFLQDISPQYVGIKTMSLQMVTSESDNPRSFAIVSITLKHAQSGLCVMMHFRLG